MINVIKEPIKVQRKYHVFSKQCTYLNENTCDTCFTANIWNKIHTQLSFFCKNVFGGAQI